MHDLDRHWDRGWLIILFPLWGPVVLVGWVGQKVVDWFASKER